MAADVTLFFDGACPLCSREARHYRRLLNEDALGLVDIAAPQFDARAHGLSPTAVHKSLHAKLANGDVVDGVDAFAAIWQMLPRYRWLATLCRTPGIRQCMQAGYAVFARARPYLPGRSCSSSCQPS